MGDLTRNLSRIEIACKCGCGFDTIDFETVTVLQHCVDEFEGIYSCKILLEVTSGCRCLKHNRDVKSKDTSQHVLGRAVDFNLYRLLPNQKKYVDPKLIRNYLDAVYSNRFGIGLYPLFVHLDTKSGPRRRW